MQMCRFKLFFVQFEIIIAREHSVTLVKYCNSVRYFETVALTYSRDTTTKVMVWKYELFTAHNAFFILCNENYALLFTEYKII